MEYNPRISPKSRTRTIVFRRKGRKVKISPLNNKSSSRVKSLRESSFQIHGPRLFNTLPKYLRNMKHCGVDEFKEKLDHFLSKIPDEPKVGQLVPACCNLVTIQPSNSLVDQIRVTCQEGMAAGT